MLATERFCKKSKKRKKVYNIDPQAIAGGYNEKGLMSQSWAVVMQNGSQCTGNIRKEFLSRGLYYKIFTAVPSKPFQPSLMFAGETRSLPECGAPESCFTLVGSGLTWKH